MKMKRSIRRLTSRLVLGVLMLTVSVLSLSSSSAAQIGIGISVRIGPPALPVYAQPICPGPGYLWTPGYWGWNDDGGYYWVPGTWVVAPVGMLWTPGYWGFAGGLYGWHAGYWGPHVGFYGGINYGFGFGGVGFAGGEWRGGAFFYNRAVMNVNVVNIRNVYSRTVVVNNVHTSFNGPGAGSAKRTRTGRQPQPGIVCIRESWTPGNCGHRQARRVLGSTRRESERGWRSVSRAEDVTPTGARSGGRQSRIERLGQKRQRQRSSP